MLLPGLSSASAVSLPEEEGAEQVRNSVMPCKSTSQGQEFLLCFTLLHFGCALSDVNRESRKRGGE